MATTEFERRSPIEEFPTLWQRIVTDPLGFYAEMPETGGLGQPTIFLALCAAINALGHLLFLIGLRGMIAVFVWQIVAAFVLAGFFVLIAQNLFAGRAGFEPTFRVVASLSRSAWQLMQRRVKGSASSRPSATSDSQLSQTP